MYRVYVHTGPVRAGRSQEKRSRQRHDSSTFRRRTPSRAGKVPRLTSGRAAKIRSASVGAGESWRRAPGRRPGPAGWTGEWVRVPTRPALSGRFPPIPTTAGGKLLPESCGNDVAYDGLSRPRQRAGPPQPSSPRNGGSSRPILRLHSACGVGQTVRRDFLALLELLRADKIYPVIAERLPLSARTNAGAFGDDGKARTRAICRRGMLADVARRPSTHTDALTMSAMNQGCDQAPKPRSVDR